MIPSPLKSNYLIISVCLISLLFSLFLISPVLLTIPKTPPDTINMMVGHYFEDYYEYITFVKEGQNGHLILSNVFSNDDPSRYVAVWWPYSLMGFITYLFKLSIPVQIIFWSSGAVFSFVFFMLIFLAVSRLLPKEKRVTKLFAFLFVLFSGDLFTVSLSPTLTLTPISYWYAIGSPFSRFSNVTPHHQITQIIFLAGLLYICRQNKNLNFIKETCILFIFSLLLLSLSPPQLILFWLAFFTTKLICTLVLPAGDARKEVITKQMKFSKNTLSLKAGDSREGLPNVASLGITEGSLIPKEPALEAKFGKPESQDPQIIINTFCPFLFSVLLILPFALLLSRQTSSSPSLLAGRIWDTSHYFYPSLALFVQNTGPLFILAALGLPFYFSRQSLPRLLFFTITIFSFFLVLTPQFRPLLSLVGIHNLRFNTTNSYIFLAVSSVILINTVFKKSWFKLTVFFSILLFFLASLYINWRVMLKVPYSAGNLQYVPLPLYQAIKLLEKTADESVILTSPDSLYGLLVTATAGKRVYLGRSIFTLDLYKKAAKANEFYSLNMSPPEAEKFLKREKIGSILLAPWEADVNKMLLKYSFLKISFQNNYLTIFTY